MVRIFLYSIAIVSLIYLMALFVTHIASSFAANSLAAVSPAAVAPAVTSVATSTAAFSQTGTLVFYPNNVTPVPYLLYQNSKGATVGKALLINNPPPHFSTWSGAQVQVEGEIVAEHVVVTRINFIKGP